MRASTAALAAVVAAGTTVMILITPDVGAGSARVIDNNTHSANHDRAGAAIGSKR
jgi:hypothetical protein